MVSLGLRLAAIAVLGATLGCDLGSTAIPASPPMLVVHAILNGEVREQVILVELSLTGSRPDDQNGIGTPVAGAVVTLTAPDGQVMTAQPFGDEGAYVIDLDAYSSPEKRAEIIRGGVYKLSVNALGMTVSGRTLVPDAPTAQGSQRVAFNRDHDTVHVSMPDVPLARAYWVRLEAPLSAYSLFTFDREASLTGDTRNFFTDELLRVFVPGFVQELTVAAMDSNLYDYYRSGSDPFSGAGLINRLEGGLGVFGSVVILERREIDVTQDPTGDPIEGEYTRRTANATLLPMPHTVRLFLEAKGPLPQGPDRITGSYVREAPAPFPHIRGAVYGTRTGSQIELDILATQSNTETAMFAFRGTIRGDTLLGSYGPNFPAIYVKAGK